MIIQYNELPDLHRQFLLSSNDYLKKDKRILGVAGGGSLISGNMDEFSDLDLVLIIDPSHYKHVLNERRKIALGMGSLL